MLEGFGTVDCYAHDWLSILNAGAGENEGCGQKTRIYIPLYVYFAPQAAEFDRCRWYVNYVVRRQRRDDSCQLGEMVTITGVRS